jgi:hypothetical protein
MEGRLADFCDAGWQLTLEAASVAVVIKATSMVATAPQSIEDMIGVSRLPRVLITEAVEFVKANAEACVLARAALPSMPVRDPWDEKRKAELEKRVLRSVGQVLTLAQKHWGFSREQTSVSRCAASTELLTEVARQWEDGRRAYYKALQKCDAVTGREPTEGSAVAGRQVAKRTRGKRGPTAEAALREVIKTEGGWLRIFAAGTDVKIGALIGKKRGAVIRTTVWKQEIKGRLKMLRAERQATRREIDERRCDRYETD